MSKKIRSVLVVYKKSNYQIYVKERKDPRILTLEKENSELLDSMRLGHEENARTMRVIRDVLQKRKWKSRWLYRARRERREGVDLVIAVGGDGTLLEAARQIRDHTPLLGVNSSPSFSVGHLLTATAESFEYALERILVGDLPCHALSRIQVSVDEQPLAGWALNDVLFCHPNPAATSRYSLHLDERTEEHRASGIWVSTAAGSTAAISSAGGQRMCWQDQRLQFRVRELYAKAPSSFVLDAGFLQQGQSLQCVSHMRKAHVYLDGPWKREIVQFGQTIDFSQAPVPLHLYHDGNGKTE